MGTAVADPLTGRVLDRRYRIGDRIARGGMAGVYEATDLRLDRTVAVKIMHAGLGSDDEFAIRFVREARAVARLSHPNVVQVFDQGEEDGVVFLVMELVRGHTLRDTVAADAPMSPTRALSLLEPIVAALAAAHRAGLVHRDVKPENVLIASGIEPLATRVKVADFGLAKAVSAETQQTATGILIGTVSYIAPELVTEGRSDARADVYAVGVMLYELLTGSKPHAGETPIQVAYKHVHQDVPAPSRAVPGIPAYVDALVARATARDVDQRPADAGVLLHQMHRVAHALDAGVTSDSDLTADLTPRRPPEQSIARPAVARPETTRENTVRPPVPPLAAPGRPRRRRGPRRGLVLLLLALLLAGGLGGGAYYFGVAQYTSTPGIIGMSRSAAEAALTHDGLALTVSHTAYSDTVPAGHVISSDPKPGARIHHGDDVDVTMSKGVEEYSLPHLVGLTVDQAQDRITGVKMIAATTITHWSETVPAGRIITSRPAAGTVLRPGTVVRIVASKGRRPIPVADFVGRSSERAMSGLKARGLRPSVSSIQYSDTVPDGDVISQTPHDGTLHLGDGVQLVVSQGPELVSMPRVVAVGVKDATTQLEALGLKVAIKDSDQYIGLNYVLKTDPSAGTMVPKGHTVTLYLV